MNTGRSPCYYASMPRSIRPPSPEAIVARTRLRAYLEETGTSETALSKASGVPQYTISRFLTGRIKTITSSVQILMKYAIHGITLDLEELMTDARIRHALGSAWDGTENGTALLAQTLDALAPVIRGVQQKPIGDR